MLSSTQMTSSAAFILCWFCFIIFFHDLHAEVYLSPQLCCLKNTAGPPQTRQSSVAQDARSLPLLGFVSQFRAQIQFSTGQNKISLPRIHGASLSTPSSYFTDFFLLRVLWETNFAFRKEQQPVCVFSWCRLQPQPVQGGAGPSWCSWMPPFQVLRTLKWTHFPGDKGHQTRYEPGFKKQTNPK